MCHHRITDFVKFFVAVQVYYKCSSDFYCDYLGSVINRGRYFNLLVNSTRVCSGEFMRQGNRSFLIMIGVFLWEHFIVMGFSKLKRVN